MSISAALVPIDVPVCSCMTNVHGTQVNSPSWTVEDSRNRRYHDGRNHRYSNRTILVLIALVTLLLVQYNNSIYTLSFVGSINFQRFASIEITNINATTIATSVDAELYIADAPATPRRRVLIAQYTGTAATQSFPSSSSSNIYDQFLWMTSKLNAAYAVKWKHDFWIMHGIAFRDPNGTTPQNYTIEKLVIDGRRQPPCNDDCWNNSIVYNQLLDNVPQSRSTYNKVAILELALKETQYDGLLLLDADAMMYDFSRNIADLLSPNSVLIAHKTNNSEGSHTGSINVGVTLWNLRHKLTPYVARRWKSNCLRRIMYHSDKLDDDQAPLQFLLKRELDQKRRDKVVYAIEDEFYYARGTFIRHFIRPAGSTWMNNTMDSESIRLMKIQRSANEVCTKYHMMCDD
jgi:hypothetical protein